LFVLITIVSLNRMGPEVSLVLVFLTAAHFIFWYGLHFAGNQDFAREMWQYDAGVINTGDPQGRRAIHDRIATVPGRHLVFVRYRVGHAFQEWVYNAADIDSSRIVWARDLGDDENDRLRHYYPDRAVWLLRPDVTPPLLTPYVQAAVQPTTETVVTQPDQSGPKKPKPKLHFEEVP
jgi:hypothetical protein